jgi:hypothetical protein
MSAALVLQVGSTFVCNNLADLLPLSLKNAGVETFVRLTEPEKLGQHMLEPTADSEEIAGTIILVRVEDWLRARPEQADDKTVRTELKTHLDEFLGQVSVLAMRGRPVWLMICPSNGWVAGKYNFAALCRTYTNLLAARLRNLPQITMLVWPQSLSRDEFCDHELDQASHVPYRPAGFAHLAEALAHQLVRILSASNPRAVASAASLGSPELANFLAGLRVQVNVVAAKPSDSTDVGRILRTAASFSLAGERPTLMDAEATAIVDSQDCLLVRVADRLSDFGASGVVVARAEPGALVVESLSLSCTVLGKQVEFALLGALREIASARGLSAVAFEYRDSGRNQPALAFLKSVADEETSGRYVLPVGEAEARIDKAAVAPGAWALNVEI